MSIERTITNSESLRKAKIFADRWVDTYAPAWKWAVPLIHVQISGIGSLQIDSATLFGNKEQQFVRGYSKRLVEWYQHFEQQTEKR